MDLTEYVRECATEAIMSMQLGSRFHAKTGWNISNGMAYVRPNGALYYLQGNEKWDKRTSPDVAIEVSHLNPITEERMRVLFQAGKSRLRTILHLHLARDGSDGGLASKFRTTVNIRVWEGRVDETTGDFTIAPACDMLNVREALRQNPQAELELTGKQFSASLEQVQDLKIKISLRLVLGIVDGEWTFHEDESDSAEDEPSSEHPGESRTVAPVKLGSSG
ncbi:uncharacterized protein F4822DRAFT_416728 [Hypoxylon trugodes]|uniref:uncharacterized protein n=1 Tax=Hypoxylon trugodes TaxID=326681 RepID=UPI00218F5591|nr:uncharacterized protein F4822DRAFT_416728 [Hypoxylon trugodes]KAI1384931.1 hypothetical protein F4822DRAFT_416728 [Hypoxylon trugodes]